MALTKETAQELIQMMKLLVHTGVYVLPSPGTEGTMDLRSADSPRDRFTVRINRKGRIKPNKYTLMLIHPAEGLLRIDVDGSPHRNPPPDCSVVPCPHIHMRIKDTGVWDAYAYEIPAVFLNVGDCARTVKDFLSYCRTNNIHELQICEQGAIQNDEGENGFH